MNKWLLLSAGGVAGTVGRYWVASWVPGLAGIGFPYGTLVINLSACFIIGMFSSMSEIRGIIGPEGRLLLMTGFCGAYSTFSTWILETASLVNDGEMLRAAANVLGSFIAGFILFRIGAYLGALW